MHSVATDLVLANGVVALLVFLLFTYLYEQNRHSYFRAWQMGWAAYTLYYGLKAVEYFKGPSALLFFLSSLLLVVMVLCVCLLYTSGALVAKVAPQQDDAVRRAGVLLIGVVLVYGGAVWVHHAHAYLLHAANGQTLLTENKTEQAIAELKAAVRQRPDSVPGHYDLARAYAIKGDLTDAESELKRVIALNPQFEDAYYSLCLLYTSRCV